SVCDRQLPYPDYDLPKGGKLCAVQSCPLLDPDCSRRLYPALAKARVTAPLPNLGLPRHPDHLSHRKSLDALASARSPGDANAFPLGLGDRGPRSADLLSLARETKSGLTRLRIELNPAERLPGRQLRNPRSYPFSVTVSGMASDAKKWMIRGL